MRYRYDARQALAKILTDWKKSKAVIHIIGFSEWGRFCRVSWSQK